MGINQYWEIIRERRWIVITAFVTTLLSTLAGSLLWPPQYEATATLVFDYESNNPMNLTMSYAGGMTQSVEYLNTQIEIMKSRKIAVGVIDYLKLDKMPAVIEAFNKAQTKSRIFFREENGDQDIKVWLAEKFLSKNIKVEPARDSRLMYIKFYSPDPGFSAAVANAYAKVYSEYNLELKVIPFREAGQWFLEKIKDVKIQVDESNERLLEYQRKRGIISDEGHYYDDTVQGLMQINSQMVAAKAKLYEAEGAMRRVNESKGSYETLPEVLSSTFIQSLKGEKIKLETHLSELSGKVGTKHPQYLRIQSELRTISDKISAEIKNVIDALKKEYDSAKERVTNLEKAVSSQKNEALNLNVSRYEMESLNRESAALQQAYETVLKKFNDTVLQGDINRTNIFLIDPAVPPSRKHSPNLVLNMALALFAGVFLGIGLAFFFDYLDDTIRSSEIVEQELDIPVLGIIAPLNALRILR